MTDEDTYDLIDNYDDIDSLFDDAQDFEVEESAPPVFEKTTDKSTKYNKNKETNDTIDADTYDLIDEYNMSGDIDSLFDDAQDFVVEESAPPVFEKTTEKDTEKATDKSKKYNINEETNAVRREPIDDRSLKTTKKIDVKVGDVATELDTPKSESPFGIDEDTGANYDVDSYNRGMEANSTDVVSDADCKKFIKSICSHEPALKSGIKKIVTIIRK